jgi:hypothetical protein
MPTLKDALALAANGWEVLPLRGKIPITAHGVKDATTNAEQITAWWGRNSHNIGARVPPSLLVLDVDPQNGGSVAALEALAGLALPLTLTVRSGRGTGGEHRYFLHPGGPVSSTRLTVGIDVKTNNGYCVMPPSLHPATGKPYLWQLEAIAALPAAFIDQLRPASPAVRRHSLVSPAQSGSLETRALYLARYVESLGEGQRNAGLFWAGCRAVEAGHPESTFALLEAAAAAAGLDELEARRTIASARRVGVGK